MSAVSSRGFVPHRHRHRGLKNYQLTTTTTTSSSSSTTTCDDEPEQKRPKVNPIFLWASQHDQKIVEVRCEDYDKRNRIKLTKTPQGWRSIPRTASNTYAGRSCFDTKDSSSEKENGDKDDQLRLANGDLEEFGIKDRLSDNWIIDNEKREKLVRLHSEKIRIHPEVIRIRPKEMRIHSEEILAEEKIRMLQEKIQLQQKEERIQHEEEVRKRQEQVRMLQEKVRIQQEEMEKLENLRKLEEIMFNGKAEGQVELKNRNAIRKRSEIRRNDELRKKEKQIAEEEQRRKRQEIQKKMQRRKLEELEKKLELQKKVRHRKRKKEHVVLGYSTTDGINAWKMRKRRNPKQKRKRRSVSGVCTTNTINSISTLNGINMVNDVNTDNAVNTANKVHTVNTDSDVHTINSDSKVHSINVADKVQIINTVNDVNTTNNDDTVNTTNNFYSINKVKTTSRSATTDRNSSNNGSTISNRISILNRSTTSNRNTISSTNNRSTISSNRGINTISEEVGTKKPKTQKGDNAPKRIDFDHLMQPRVVLEQLQLTEMEDGQHYKNTSKNLQEDSYIPSDDDLQDSESVDRDSVEREIVDNEFEDGEILNRQIEDRQSLQKSPNPDIMEMALEKVDYEEDQVQQEITNLEDQETLHEREKADHNEESQTDMDHSSDDDFQDILKMLDSTSFGNSKLVLSLKSAKLLEELELSLTGIEDDVEKSDEQVEEPQNYSPSPLQKTPLAEYPNKCLKDVEIVEVIESNSNPKPTETDSSRILKALRNTPGLSVSVTKKNRSPDSQMQEIAIAIPNWRLGTKSERGFSESPESTVRIDSDERERTDPKKAEVPKKSLLQVVSSNEAQAKQVSRFEIEDPKTRSVVSPQPSGIPCSPILPRSSSAYLERLLPSPPCSVSCSEDAKNDLTLKGILSTPCLEPETTQKPNHQDEERPNMWKTPEVHPTYQNRLTNSQNDFLLAQQRHYLRYQHFRNTNQQWETFVDATSTISDIPQSPATQLRQLLKTVGHLIPDPLLVPRHCLPGLAAAPSIEIPKLLTSRPELRLPEALNRPELLRDPDLLVISIAHLQYVLDQGHDSFGGSGGGGIGRMGQQDYGGATMDCVNTMAKKTTNSGNIRVRPKLSCKPIGTLMPAPIDLSRSRKNGSSYSSLLRVRTGLLKQEPEVSSTGSNLEEHQLWHPLFSRQRRPQQQKQQNYQATWHTTTFAS
ncbi:uncharacterized protein LOC122506730 [Leptopilina heterotoma]|uniref:uncharacterized protein LOC122506730 n=1 Tax=Leptopilina heterotoma TaxID=63436 RepID=UPI001CA9670F|nr:uncharacterized protein LOC122506730 [Leptopilina heterotoma]